jgi:cytochrome P450
MQSSKPPKPNPAQWRSDSGWGKISLYQYVMHRNPPYCSGPEQFDPERFDEETRQT